MLKSGRPWHQNRNHGRSEKAKGRTDEKLVEPKKPGNRRTQESEKSSTIESGEEVEKMEEDCPAPTSSSPSPPSSQPDTEMDGLAGAMSSLKFIPTSIRFGRGSSRGGFSRT